MSLKRSHEPNEAAEPAAKRPNRAPKPSWKKREGDGSQPTQPTKLNQKVQQVPIESLETTPDPLENTPEPPETTPSALLSRQPSLRIARGGHPYGLYYKPYRPLNLLMIEPGSCSW